ncbi:MAG: tetratricopeptide repeat protein, partial [Gammaproteobacteria bacterium]|nr:tetratricopeptide repeat protein [Gammaproteobacteria bacterium]
QAESLRLNESGSRAIILLTDGDVSQEKFKQLAQFSGRLQQENITLHLLGVGTPSPIALADNDGRWLQYEGKTVVTRLKETELQTLAENKNVFYDRLNPAVHNKLSNVWQASPTRIAAQDFDEVLWNELFSWFLIPALLLIIFNHLSIPRFLLSVLSPAIAITIIAWVVHPSPVFAYGHADDIETLEQAYASWQNKNYATAAKQYARIDGYRARMGEGASCFRDKQLECAITAFSRAVWQAATDEQRGQAAFNLGNSFFRQGDFKSAITLYKDALRYQPRQASYQNNLEFSEEVQRNIERRLKQEADSQKAARRRSNKSSGENQIDIDNQQLSDKNRTLADKIKNGQTDNLRRLNLSEEQLAYYMQRSQNFARLSSGRNERAQRQHDWSRFSNENPVAARRVEYWQRLFELEEDIPAHPESPKILPGIPPW